MSEPVEAPSASRPVPRRRVLGWAAGSVGALVVGGTAGVVRLAGRGRVEDDPWFASIRRVGEAYLDAEPGDRSGDALRSGPLAGWGPSPDRRRAQFADLAPAVRDDFTEGRTVDVGGWRLSRTEARAAALAVLDSA